ncbi:hypothetical protein HKX48_003178 [Thoreauomyces humboldtii]|nr:hypothetical protein HKX48_003178 [Thoreauomyces humboldtii]
MTQNNDLPALCSELHRALATSGLSSPDISIPEITDLLQSYTAPDYAPYTQHDPTKPYTRTLLDNGNGHFNLMVLVWTPGAKSPVHDHAGSHCLMKILEGGLAETLYETQEPDGRVDSGIDEEDSDAASSDGGCGKSLRVTKQSRLCQGDVAYVHDKIGLHKISNPSSSQRAVSLHLYTPPFDYCKTYCETTGQARPSGRCVFFQDFSKKKTTVPDAGFPARCVPSSVALAQAGVEVQGV